MKKKIGDAKAIRNEALAGISVMFRDIEKAEDLLDAIKAPGELLMLEGNRFTSFVAVDEEALDGLTDFHWELKKSKISCCLALAVPVKDLQTDPVLRPDGTVERTFCSTNGLPIRTYSDEQGYDAFKRPSFWLTKLVVSSGMVVFYSTLFGQFRDNNGGLEYQPMTRKSFDTSQKCEVEKPITRTCESEEKASRELNINSGFLYAMVRPAVMLADNQRRRQGLRASVNRTAAVPLTVSMGEMIFPGLVSLKASEMPKKAKAKKAKATKTEESVTAE